MKKRISVLLALVMVFALCIAFASCKDKTPDEPDDTAGTTTESAGTTDGPDSTTSTTEKPDDPDNTTSTTEKPDDPDSTTSTTEKPDDPEKHEAKAEWKFDETHHWHECATAGHTDKLDEAEHKLDAGVITAQPTEEKEGEKTFTCADCGYKKTEPVAKLEHTHKYDESNWEKNETHHWHKATCEHTSEKKDYAEHTFGEWTEKTAADYGVNKVEKRVCTACAYEEERTLPNSSLEYTGDFYLIINDVITANGEVLIIGDVARGKINVGDKIEISGYDGELTVQKIRKNYSAVQSAGYGDTGIEISIGKEVDRSNIKRGTIASKPGSMKSYIKFTAKIYVYKKGEEGGGRNIPIFSGYKVYLQWGNKINTGVQGTITLPSDVEPGMPGQEYTVTITLRSAIPLWEGMEFYCVDGSSGSDILVIRGTVISVIS